jgi:hypothetical protein
MASLGEPAAGWRRFQRCSADLAAALTCLSERLSHLAAISTEPFADEEALADVLTHI